MYPYILCYCGRAIGDIYDIFKEMRREKYIAAYGTDEIDPSILAISSTVDVDLIDVFDQLRVHTDCCRARLMSQVEFKEYY